MEGAARAIDRVEKNLEKEIEKVTRGDELPPGVVKLVKVYVAKKRKLSVGDKMAGTPRQQGRRREDPPEEDMPYLPDGTPVDMVLNPLGVPSRMNIGQILETHLGWAAHELGHHGGDAGVRRRDGGRDQGAVSGRRICPRTARRVLYDGRHGRVVRSAGDGGLHLHDEALAPGRRQDPRALASDRTRSSPSSRWAARRSSAASGSAKWKCGRSRRTAPRYTLQELLTVKSDDVDGTVAHLRGDREGREPARTAARRSRSTCWCKELQSLCMDVQLRDEP